MTRAPLVLAATVAGMAATLGFHARSPAQQPATATAVATTSSASSGTGTARKASAADSTGTTGDAVDTQYGPVQLKVTVSGGKITSIEAVQLPQGDPKSSSISSYAAPLLQESALSRQDGQVDAVSGATYTSDGYATALQSALDKAGFQA